MTTTTFAEWVANFGEKRLAENIASSQKAGQRHWEERTDATTLRIIPGWELCFIGNRWYESLDEWHSRWERCGGRLSEGRMIAAKWDPIWTKLSSTFDDGLGEPYPPYARSSDAYWMDVDQDEAIVVGAITESEFSDCMAQFPREQILSKDGQPLSSEQLRTMYEEVLEEIDRNGGQRPPETRAGRVALKRKMLENSVKRSHAEYEKRNAEREEQNAVFRLLEKVELSLKDSPSPKDASRWQWLCSSVGTLTKTSYFECYPNWLARAWLACAEMHRLLSDPANELSCLELALSFNNRLPIKRRIKALR